MSMPLPLYALRDKVLFPGDFGPLFEGRAGAQAALDFALAAGGRVAVATQRVAAADAPRPDEIFHVGTLCEITERRQEDEDVVRVVLEVKERVRLDAFAPHKPGLFRKSGFYMVEPHGFPDGARAPDGELRPIIERVIERFRRLCLKRGLPPEGAKLIEGAALGAGEQLAQHAVHYLAVGESRHFIPVARRQALLEAPSLRARLELFVTVLDEQL